MNGVEGIDDFDIDRAIAHAWAEFGTRLAEVLSMVDESGDLTIGTATGDGAPDSFLRFSSPARDRLRCEAGVAAGRGQDEQVGTLVSDGWERTKSGGPQPAGCAVVATECPQDDSETMAELAVRALRDVFGVQHPVFLAPDQLAEVLQPDASDAGSTSATSKAEDSYAGRVLEPTRATRRGTSVEIDPEDLTSTLPDGPGHLNRMVDAELTSMYGHPPFRDNEGDVAIRVGSTMLFLRTSGDGKEVTVFSAVVHDVSGRSRATEVINDLNVESRWVKFQLVRDRVFASMSVLAQPFVPAHLHQAVRVVSDVADGIDEELAAKLDGRTTFTE
ncbi:MAG TPA: YbjN domain-containing protein [Friedmanniella sp.]